MSGLQQHTVFICWLFSRFQLMEYKTNQLSFVGYICHINAVKYRKRLYTQSFCTWKKHGRKTMLPWLMWLQLNNVKVGIANLSLVVAFSKHYTLILTWSAGFWACSLVYSSIIQWVSLGWYGVALSSVPDSLVFVHRKALLGFRGESQRQFAAVWPFRWLWERRQSIWSDGLRLQEGLASVWF